MIIQCEKCATKFRLDDAKVTDNGVKVRCSRCRQVFTVYKEELSDGLPEDFSSYLDNASSGEQEFPVGNEPAGVESPNANQTETDEYGDDGAFDESIFGASSLPTEEPGSSAPPPVPELTAVTGPSEEQPSDVPEEAAFSFDDLFKDAFSPAGDAGTDDAPPTEQESAGHEDTEYFAAEDTPVDTVSDTAAEEVSSTVAALSGSDTPVEQEPEADASAPEAAAAPVVNIQPDAPVAEELPPLSISSRRRRSPLVSALLVLLCLGLLGVAGYLGYPLVMENVAPPSENGRITVRSVEASFIKNRQSGELLVISGEAVNGFAVPRAAIQLKGVVYAANGQVVASKAAYAGNPINSVLAADMPLEKIEAAMANQFGESLVNLDVPPGRPVSFTIVMAVPAGEAKDYGVEVIGSTAPAKK